MNSFEVDAALAEVGINAPERCKSCVRVCDLVGKLSIAQDNKNFLVVSSSEEMLTANMRAQLTEQVIAKFPGAPEEQVARTVDDAVTKFLEGEECAAFLQQTGIHLDEEEATIATTVDEISQLISACPPEGCNAS